MLAFFFFFFFPTAVSISLFSLPATYPSTITGSATYPSTVTGSLVRCRPSSLPPLVRHRRWFVAPPYYGLLKRVAEMQSEREAETRGLKRWQIWASSL